MPKSSYKLAWIILFACILAFAGCNAATARVSATTTVAPIPSHGKIVLTTVPIASTGCNKPPTLAPGMSVEQTIISGGISRSYRLHIPTAFANDEPHALVLNFHGHGSTMAQQEARTHFSTLADHYGVVVVYPQGVVGPDHHTGWDIGPSWDPTTDDVLFVSDLLNHLQQTLCIDPRRIFATGFSNGGGMTNLLACDMAGRFAAFAPVAGSYPTVPGGCHPLRPVSLLEIHGTADPVVPYLGDNAKGYPSITDWLQGWIQRDDCIPTPRVILQQGAVLGEGWQGCGNGVALIHYRIGGMGHIWPDGTIKEPHGQTTTFNATTVIWSFFQDHPLPPNATKTKTA